MADCTLEKPSLLLDGLAKWGGGLRTVGRPRWILGLSVAFSVPD
jgi:hypothetical protein